MDFETPEADAAEQAREERPDEDEPTTEASEAVPAQVPDADPADVAEQQRIVPDTDEYNHG